MGQTEYKIFIVLATLILLVFINGILVFIVQYRKRKLQHEREKDIINEKHREDLLHTRLDIQSQTMQDIGREIHDNVGQRLTLAAIYANQLSFENRNPDIQNKLAQVSTIINESLAELRSLSKNLTNASIEVTELNALIQNECERVNELNICKASFSFDNNNYNISTTLKIFILRIVQEFIQNSLKHAECKNISIAFHHSADGLEVVATDDGKGFNMKNADNRGIGLLNMQKRAELIGADFTIFSEHGKGTVLKLSIPANKLNV